MNRQFYEFKIKKNNQAQTAFNFSFRSFELECLEFGIRNRDIIDV